MYKYYHDPCVPCSVYTNPSQIEKLQVVPEHCTLIGWDSF